MTAHNNTSDGTENTTQKTQQITFNTCRMADAVTHKYTCIYSTCIHLFTHIEREKERFTPSISTHIEISRYPAQICFVKQSAETHRDTRRQTHRETHGATRQCQAAARPRAHTNTASMPPWLSQLNTALQHCAHALEQGSRICKSFPLAKRVGTC